MATIEKSVDIDLSCPASELVEQITRATSDLTCAQLYITGSDEWGFEAELCFDYEETPEEEKARLELEAEKTEANLERRLADAYASVGAAKRAIERHKKGELPF